MKRNVSIALTLATLCGLIIPTIIAAASASAPGYAHTTYSLANAVTLDGQWSGTEWADTDVTSIGGTTAMFRSKWYLASMDPITVSQYIVVEILNDNTNDTNDYYQFCFDGDESGGATPQAGDIRIDIIGHRNMTAYNGNGASWAPVSAPSTFQWRDSISTSPTSSTPHWICEIMIDKVSFGIGADYWLRIAVNDASNSAAGVRAWPPTSRDVPNDWGDIPYSSETTPEGISSGIIVLLSSVAMLAGFVTLRKRPRNIKWKP
jgi:hypothetical protein